MSRLAGHTACPPPDMLSILRQLRPSFLIAVGCIPVPILALDADLPSRITRLQLRTVDLHILPAESTQRPIRDRFGRTIAPLAQSGEFDGHTGGSAQGYRRRRKKGG